MGLPLSGLDFIISFEVAGRPPVPPSQQPAMQVRVATPDYFECDRHSSEARAVGSARTTAPDTPQVVLITEAAARQFFPGEDPIGKTIKLGWGRGPGKPRAGGEVVGVVGDIKDAGLNEENPPQIYLPLRQWPVSFMTVVVKTAVPPTVARRRGTRAGRRDRSEPAAVERQHARRRRREVDLAAALLHDAADDFRRGGADPRRDRDFRRALVRRVAADARDRHPHGARRAGAAASSA